MTQNFPVLIGIPDGHLPTDETTLRVPATCINVPVLLIQGWP